MNLHQSSTSLVPEQGQLVEVRRRPYVVTEVTMSSLPASVLDNHPPQMQHLVTLSAIEDDALGEELQVIWELESGTRVQEQAKLPAPRGFDPPDRFDAFLNAVRWGAVVSADGRALQAPFRSGIDIEDYQLDPVARAIQMPRANLLIADDVGLGKTIEAGLVVQEMIIRQRVRTILVVCPSSLQLQWQDQMRDKFGLEFRIISSETMHSLRRARGIHVNPWTHFPRLITSIDYLKRDRPMRLMRETLPARGESVYPRRYDLLIVDEAHNIAPSGRGRYAIDSQRTRAIRDLAPHFEHKLFLTATPHNGYAESFSALLELLDNQRFARGVEPDRDTLAAVMVRRLKTELPNDDFGRPRFHPRSLEAIPVRHREEERAAHRQLQTYSHLRQRHTVDSTERTVNEFVLKLLKKRLFSSPAAFAKTLAQHTATLTAAPAASRTASRGARPAAGPLRARLESMEEEYGDDTAFDEAVSTALHTAGRLFRPLTAAERDLLDSMQQWANRAASGSDSKATRLIHWLNQEIRPNGVWSDQRVIIFTEYRDTQNWLHTLLAGNDLATEGRLMTLHGGLPADERERIKAAFLAGPDVSAVRILLATDAASEGIDLQRHCHRLIHYEIPWNPNRMEQRNGRIDRHGQRHPPRIFHFAPEGIDGRSKAPPHTGDQERDLEWDLEFLMVAVRKVEQIREDLGKVGPVIADQVTEAMLGRRGRLQTEDAEAAAQPARRQLRFERDLEQRIRDLSSQLADSRRELAVSPENVQAVVEVGLSLAGQPALEPAALPGLPQAAGSAQAFHLPPLRGSWAYAGQGLAHPHTGEIRPIVFDHNLARGRDDVVLAHLNHRLVQMCLRLLRAQVWELAGRKLHRVTARLVPDHLLPHLAFIAHARLVVLGGDSRRLHEEIIFAGGEVRDNRFRRFDTLARIQELLNAATVFEPGSQIKDRLAPLWQAVEPGLDRALEVRRNDRVASLDRVLDQRQSKELADVQAILLELQHAIRAELEEAPLQLPLFSQDERDQYVRNREALEARLAHIPLELEQEQATIRRRYAGRQSRLFPVAVTFLVPQRLAR